MLKILSPYIEILSPLSGVLEVTRSLLDSDHGEEALLESYTRVLHEIGLECDNN